MGCSLTFLAKTTKKLIEKKVLILGIDNAGKSALLYQIKDQQFKDTAPTIGLNVENVELGNYSVCFWDVGGQATMLWSHYYEDTNAILFIVDSSDIERLPQVKLEFQKLMNESKLSACPVIIVANKIDIEKHISDKELLDTLEYTTYLPNKKIRFIKSSAKLGEGIKELKSQIIDAIAPITPVSTETNNSPQSQAK